MVCTKCGARLMETDQFCPKCGAKVVKAIKEKKCPDCGEILRDGVKFCPGCGRAVSGRNSRNEMADGSLDIPIEAIERNILSETAAEIKKERRTEPGSRKSVSVKEAPVRRAPSGSTAERGRASSGESVRSTRARRAADAAPARKPGGTGGVSGDVRPKKKQSSVPAPPRKKQPVYREEVWEEDNWDEEEDWDEEDWEDDWDDEEDGEGIDAITIMTVVVGCVLLIVVAFLGYQLLRQYLPKNYDKAAEQEEQQQEQEPQEELEMPEQDGEESGSQEPADGGSGGISKITIESNVNVRDQPSTSGTNVLKVAKAGETYVCNGVTEDGTWYEIVLDDGAVGYVFHEYISVE